MTDKRLDQLSGEVYNSVFAMLDSEPDFTGDEAGRIANKLEQVFRELTHADHVCVECGNPTEWTGLCSDCADYCPGDDGQPSEHDEWMSFDPDC